jgi:hypothetical protein
LISIKIRDQPDFGIKDRPARTAPPAMSSSAAGPRVFS